MDITEQLCQNKISVALFHTAGKGTRLAPLPGSENNNKPGVKLPGLIVVNGKKVPITILESVIKQTGCYASSRKGRLSVFWGDQVFIPTAPVQYTPQYHVDILCSLGPMLSEEEWKSKGMEKYGLIVMTTAGNGAQVEKVSHATALQLLKNFGEIASVGVSLGSFSISWLMLVELLQEFQGELTRKEGKLDTDPHFWMPMTLEKDSYIQLMQQKKVEESKATAHFDRIHRMLTRFHERSASLSEFQGYRLFGACDVGRDICWWDFGQLAYYQKNVLLVTSGCVLALRVCVCACG